MEYTLFGEEKNIAYISGADNITDAQSALDLIATAVYETNCSRFIIDKAGFSDDFFILSTGIAGEILQKFVTYRLKVAIVGDYSKYTSKPLKDFIYESNKGNAVFFVATVEDAVKKLEAAH